MVGKSTMNMENMVQSGRRGVDRNKNRFVDEKDSDEGALAYEISISMK